MNRDAFKTANSQGWLPVFKYPQSFLLQALRLNFTWGFGLKEAECRGSRQVMQSSAYSGGTIGPVLVLAHRDTLQLSRTPVLGNPCQADTAAAPLLTRECVGPSLIIPDIPQEGSRKVLCFPTLKSCAQCWFIQLTTAISISQGSSMAIIKSSAGLSQMASRMEEQCWVPCQCPATWKDDAYPMPEQTIDLWRPQEISTLPLKEMMNDLVSPPSPELWLARAEAAYICPGVGQDVLHQALPHPTSNMECVWLHSIYWEWAAPK